MKKKIIEFTKMHGTGNDYIYVNNIKFPIENPEQKAIEWSKPHFGIGSDGLILIDKSEIADFKMRIFNADGSEAMMCGNGSRCVARYLYEYQLTDKTKITLETLSGIKHLKLNIKKNKVESVTVNMGKPLEIKTIQVLDKKDLNSTFVSMGNPHVVTFVNNINTVVLDKIGPKIEHHNLFPDRTNVEFAEIIDCNKIRMRVWERGSGITMACGTGACATAIAAISQNKTSGSNEIVMDGGSVFIEWNETTKEVLMTGPAEIVFKGEIESS